MAPLTRRSNKSNTVRSSTSNGGINRLLTDHPTSIIRVKSRRNSPCSDDGAPPHKARKSRSQSLAMDSDDDRSTDEKEHERRQANNTRER